LFLEMGTLNVRINNVMIEFAFHNYNTAQTQNNLLPLKINKKNITTVLKKYFQNHIVIDDHVPHVPKIKSNHRISCKIII
jgi:hypothetical protein